MPIVKQKPIFEVMIDSLASQPGFVAHHAGRYNREVSARSYSVMDRYNSAFRDLPFLRAPWKSYASAIKIQLPRSTHRLSGAGALTFASVMQARTSVRRYTGQALSLDDLSTLLLTAVGEGWGGRTSATPSAGARLPIELYIAVIKIDGVAPGYYHYNRREHVLELVLECEDMRTSLAGAYFGDPTVDFQNASFIIVLSAIFHRTIKKYGNRGWRFLYLDAGHVGQSLGLTATALGIGACAYGGGFDSVLCETLRFNSAVEAPVLTYVFGQTSGSGNGR